LKGERAAKERKIAELIELLNRKDKEIGALYNQLHKKQQ